MSLDMKVPSYSTVYRYAKKAGFYCHERLRPTVNEFSKSKWVIIIDEKLLYLRQRLLLILGIREEEIPDDRAVGYKDVEVLSAEISEKTDRSVVSSLIEKIESKLPEQASIAYAISDEGTNLRRGIKDKNLEYIGDFRHYIANIFKKIYLKDFSYIEVTNKMAELRKKLQQTTLSELTPPALKTKCRFHNIDTIIYWWRKVKEYLLNNPQEIKAKETFSWIETHNRFFEELDKTLSAAEAIISILTIQGIEHNTIDKVMEILKKLETSSSDIFKSSIVEYFNQAKMLLEKRRKLLCSSDVIESMFGKHNRVQSANRNLYASPWTVLSLAFMTAKIECLDIKKIFEEVKLKDIDWWAKEKNLNKNKWKLRFRNQSQVNLPLDGKILEPLLI